MIMNSREEGMVTKIYLDDIGDLLPFSLQENQIFFIFWKILLLREPFKVDKKNLW